MKSAAKARARIFCGEICRSACLRFALASAFAASGCDFVAGTDAEVISSFRASAAPGCIVEISGCGAMKVTSAAFDRFAVRREGDEVFVSATADVEGTFGEGRARVSSLGREEVRFASSGRTGGWKAVTGPLPSLSHALSEMCASFEGRGERKDAAETSAAAPSDAASSCGAPPDCVRRWVVRTERYGAAVLEERTDGRRRRIDLKTPDAPLSAAASH